jgi:hypothetical protein
VLGGRHRAVSTPRRASQPVTDPFTESDGHRKVGCRPTGALCRVVFEQGDARAATFGPNGCVCSAPCRRQLGLIVRTGPPWLKSELTPSRFGYPEPHSVQTRPVQQLGAARPATQRG